MTGCFDRGISLSLWKSKLGGSCIPLLLHPRPTNGPHSSCARQHLGVRLKYLLHDRDSKYASHFSAVAAGSGIKELRTPYRAPRANGICERYMGSLRRECLDHTLVLNSRQLTRVVREYNKYFNQERPHQGISQQIPIFCDKPRENSKGRITSKAILGGLHHSYSRVV